MYEIKRDGKQWVVVTVSGNRVQYRSMSKKFCMMWVDENETKGED